MKRIIFQSRSQRKLARADKNKPTKSCAIFKRMKDYTLNNNGNDITVSIRFNSANVSFLKN